ncbi:MAG: hypothetical protein HY958_01665 [Bacteroidia bacterium]|nr:hypothetical protein [Bacteroidia bacterium]
MKKYLFKLSNPPAKGEGRASRQDCRCLLPLPALSFGIITFSILLLSSCEKVIDINLNSADPKIVVEADIFPTNHSAK